MHRPLRGLSRRGGARVCETAVALLVATGPWLAAEVASACGPLEPSAEVLVPPADGTVVPRDGALLAIVTVPDPEGSPVQLRRVADDAPVGFYVTWETTVSNEQALVVATGFGELEPNTEYAWSIGLEEFPFVTGPSIDPAPPLPGDLVIDDLGLGTITGCFGERIDVREYDVGVAGVGEPVGVYAVSRLAGEPIRFIAASQTGAEGTVRLQVPTDVAEQCFELMMMDYGGHVVSAGEACVQGQVDDGTDTGADGTGAGSGDGSATSGSPQPGTTVDAGSEDGSGADGMSVGQDGGVSDRGCACQARGGASGGAGAGLLALLGLLGAARRRRRAALV
ncbi:MAG: MYXO-CTERM sorting domain-containing protein [Nannocystaceae bacterium]